MKLRKLFFPLLTGIIITFSSCSNDDDEMNVTCTPDTSLTIETAFTEEISATHATVYTDIVINASASEVWEVVTNFENMPNWSSTF